MNQSWMRRRDCATQTLDIRGLGYDAHLHRQYDGALKGSDADWMMELGNTPAHPLTREHIFLFAEFKCDRPGARMTDTSGQKRALEALCDCLYKPHKVAAYAAEVIHTVYDAEQDIDAAAAIVERFYDPHCGEWRKPKYRLTFAEWQDGIIQTYKLPQLARGLTA